MIWTPRQQGIYRGLVTRAWAKQTTPESFHDKPAKDSWYRRTLHAQLGVWTTKQLGQDDFASACSVFERMVGESFYWTERALGGTAAERKRRAVYLIGEACREGDIDEAHAAGIARQALGGRAPKAILTQHDLGDLLKILDGVKAFNARHAEQEQSPACLAAGGGDDHDPF